MQRYFNTGGAMSAKNSIACTDPSVQTGSKASCMQLGYATDLNLENRGQWVLLLFEIGG